MGGNLRIRKWNNHTFRRSQILFDWSIYSPPEGMLMCIKRSIIKALFKKRVALFKLNIQKKCSIIKAL